MIKVNSIFKNVKYQNLSLEAKLLFIYLITHSDINILGVVPINVDTSCLRIGLTIDQFRELTLELIEKGLISVSSANGEVYFIVIDHFKSLPKGSSTANKAKECMDTLPSEIVNELSTLIDTKSKETVFVEPSVDEIEDFGMSVGYAISGKAVREYYRERAKFFRKRTGWWDGRGKQVIDWKKKIRAVWCREENKLKEVPDAPEGFRFFHVKVNDKIIYPDYWKDGKPYSKQGLVRSVELQEAYEKKRKERHSE